jgi:large subunit ribosomal protein L6
MSSRAEKKPLAIPEGVSLSVSGSEVSVMGQKGQLSFSFPDNVILSLSDAALSFSRANETRQSRMMVGTARSIVANMIRGVSSGYTKQLEIAGVGFKATLNEKILDLSLGTSHPIRYSIPDGIHLTVAEGIRLTVSGADKQKVGQVAADIRHFYPMEPYKGKGVCIVGKFVRRKEGKKTA